MKTVNVKKSSKEIKRTLARHGWRLQGFSVCGQIIKSGYLRVRNGQQERLLINYVP